MEWRPWVIEGILFSVLDFDGLTPISQLNFHKVAFWVRMFHLPLACMGRKMGMKMGSLMGEVVEVETNEEGIGWGEFLRVRIVIDIQRPLVRGRILKLRSQSIWIPFQYENIPSSVLNAE